jgi:hypothetical protein
MGTMVLNQMQKQVFPFSVAAFGATEPTRTITVSLIGCRHFGMPLKSQHVAILTMLDTGLPNSANLFSRFRLEIPTRLFCSLAGCSLGKGEAAGSQRQGQNNLEGKP